MCLFFLSAFSEKREEEYPSRNTPPGIPIMTSKIAENEYRKRKKSGTEQRVFSLAICPQKNRVYGNTKREMYWPDFFRRRNRLNGKRALVTEANPDAAQLVPGSSIGGSTHEPSAR